jgi:hypothetical protein
VSVSDDAVCDLVGGGVIVRVRVGVLVAVLLRDCVLSSVSLNETVGLLVAISVLEKVSTNVIVPFSPSDVVNPWVSLTDCVISTDGLAVKVRVPLRVGPRVSDKLSVPVGSSELDWLSDAVDVESDVPECVGRSVSVLDADDVFVGFEGGIQCGSGKLHPAESAVWRATMMLFRKISLVVGGNNEARFCSKTPLIATECSDTRVAPAEAASGYPLCVPYPGLLQVIAV